MRHRCEGGGGAGGQGFGWRQVQRGRGTGGRFGAREGRPVSASDWTLMLNPLRAPPPQVPGGIAPREGVLLCQRLGALDKAGLFDGGPPALRAKWEAGYLAMLRHMCTAPTIAKVRRGYMGLYFGWKAW